MALQKQNIPISFGVGIDTKTDPNQVQAGKLLVAQNVIFGEGMSFNKRNGYSLLASMPSGENLTTFKNELVGFDGKSLYSYSPSTQSAINKSTITSIDLSITSIYRSVTKQITQDSAFNAAGLFLFVWVDSLVGAQYLVSSSQTGNQVIPATALPSSAIYPRAWSVGNYLIITYVDNSTFHLRYISIPVVNLSNIGSPTDLSTQVNNSNSYYDGIVTNNALYLSWNGSDNGGAVRTSYLDAQLNQHNTVIQAGEAASSCISVFADTSTSTPQIWTAYCNGSQIKYFIQNANALSSILAPSTIVNGLSNINNLSGYAAGGSATIYYQTQNTYSYSSVRSDFISQVTAGSSGSVGSSSVFLKSVGLVSKIFSYNGQTYLVAAYGGALQPTYFVVNSNGVVMAKIAYSNAGGYTSTPNLTTVNTVSATQFQFAYLIKQLLSTQQGQIYTDTNINSALLDFGASDIYQTVELGQNLNINGGFLWAYDGYKPLEHNFHIFPEDFASSAIGTTGISANTYQYAAIYEWVDNQGNIFRSGYGAPVNQTIRAGTSAVINVNIPTLRLTQKQNVSISLYRNAPSIATGIFYRVSPISSPILSSTAIDSVTFQDTLNDSQIVGNELLYTTGGIVQDSGAPAAVGMVNFKNRLILITSEERNTLWYSKQTLQNTPVELSQQFTQYVDPRFGVMTAITVMDDKLILFKGNAIFYMTGEGPDNTGANNDFSEGVFITSIVGCTNFRSIILTQVGIMFQSNKGIWLLDRSLGVSYIGAPVEAYNSFLVTSANIIPNTTQVRFTLNNGTALVYDYFYKQWATFSNHYAAGATIFQNLFTYLKSNGQIYQEAPGSFTDNGAAYFMRIQTSWLSLSGLQGYQRAYRLYFLSKYISSHILNVAIGYDFDSNATQNTIIQPSYLANPNYGSDPFYGSTVYFGGYNEEEQYRINLERQKCQSIQVTISDGLDTSNPSYGAALTMEAFGLVIAQKSTYPRLPPSQIVS